MEKVSANLDFTFYMNLAGEHAWKAGVQYIRLHEDVNSGPQSPLVNIAWDDVYGLPDGDMIRGTYGYYTIRGDWVRPTAASGTSTATTGPSTSRIPGRSATG